MEPRIYSTGAESSPYDIRDFKYLPDRVPLTAPHKGGERYKPEDIEDQHRVGICTAISLTQNARKALGLKFSADFQYLLQKKYFDKNWNEGSSARSALHCAYTYGLLPQEHWTFTTEADRKLSYSKYIAKLKAVPESEIIRLLEIAKSYKLAGYARVDVTRDKLAQAVDESRAGLIVRFVVGREWYTAPIEPLRKAKSPISGHLITYCNYDGQSYRLANSWGDDWADKGTAYGHLTTYPPTEAWIPYYNDLPPSIEEQKKQLETAKGELLALIQKIIAKFNLKL
jgi:hypothetical protein